MDDQGFGPALAERAEIQAQLDALAENSVDVAALQAQLDALQEQASQLSVLVTAAQGQQQVQLQAEYDQVLAQAEAVEAQIDGANDPVRVRSAEEAKNQLRVIRARRAMDVLLGNTKREELEALDAQLEMAGVLGPAQSQRVGNSGQYRNKGLGDAQVSEAAAELLGIVTTVAVRRAKRRSLAFAQRRIEDAVCGLSYPKSIDPGQSSLLPQTCRLLQTTSLEQLASDPELIRAPLAADLITGLLTSSWAKTGQTGPVPDEINTIVRALLVVAVHSLESSGQLSGDYSALLDETFALLDDPQEGTWSQASKPVLQALAIVATNLETGVDVTVLARQLAPNASQDTLVLALELADLARTAKTAKSVKEKAIPVVTALTRVAEELVVDPAQKKQVKLTRSALLAFLEGETAGAVSAGAELALSFIPADARKAEARTLSNATSLLSAVATYSATYADAESKSTEESRKQREAALEGLIDATTSRANRAGDNVFSLGIPVGFAVTGVQWRRTREGGGTALLGSGPELMPPQLQVPLGLAYQHLPNPKKDRTAGLGLHTFVSALDVGQFLAYDQDGQISRPRWDSLVSPGGQIGMLIGSPEDTFVIGVEARYAPTLFSGTSQLTVSDTQDPGGALRVGLVLAYYVSLFDAN